MQTPAGRRRRVRDHQLARHPRRLRARPADQRADVQRVPVREHDHGDVPVGSGDQDTLDFVARKSAQRGCRSQAPGQAGITFDMVCRDNPTSPDKCTSIDPSASGVSCTVDSDCLNGDRCDGGRCISTACAKNIYIGDGCRPKDSTGVIQPDAPVDPATTPCAPLEQTACTASRSTTTSRPVARASSCSSATPRSRTPASRCATR